MTDHQLMTTEEYLRTPEALVPTELIYGVLRVAESPFAPHQAAVRDLMIAMVAYVRNEQLGEMWVAPLDVILDAARHLVLQPDLFFVSKEQSHIVTDRVRGTPDLVVEVLSPQPRIGKLGERLAWFAEYGVQECWLVHQLERRIEVIMFAEGAILSRVSFDERTPIRSTVLPGFNRTLASLLRWN